MHVPLCVALVLCAVTAVMALGDEAVAQASGDVSAEAREGGRAFCEDFPTYDDAVNYCLERYGTTVGCGGLDRDRDGMPCECNEGGAEASETACV